jgi:hypothetical protein
MLSLGRGGRDELSVRPQLDAAKKVITSWESFGLLTVEIAKSSPRNSVTADPAMADLIRSAGKSSGT